MKIPKVGVWYYKDSGTTELRFSMRSAVTNLGTEKIYLVGDKPFWFKETENSIYIPSKRSKDKITTVAWVPWEHLNNLINGGFDEKEFLLFNDDFIILRKLEEWVDYCRDPEDYNERVAQNNRVYHMREVRALSQLQLDVWDSPHFNMHIPIKIETEKLIEALEFWKKSWNKDFEFRTTYGNMFIKNAPSMVDVKYRPNGIFLSTGEEWWKKYSKPYRQMFPDKVFCER